MRRFYFTLKYELKNLLLSPPTYIATFLFLSLMGFIYIMILSDFSQSPQESLPATQFFHIFWLPAFFMIPLLTMKSLAEERRLGTLQSYLSTSLSPFSLITCKFLSAYLFYIGIWSLTLLFPLITDFLYPNSTFQHTLLFDTASLLGGYTFVALSGLFYIAIGIFSSSLTRSQLVAGMLSFSLLFVVLVGARLFMDLPFWNMPWINNLHISSEYLQSFTHLSDFSKGILDTRPFAFYLTGSVLLLALTSLITESKA